MQAYLAATTDAARQAGHRRPTRPAASTALTLGEKLDELRAIKTPEELALLRRAIRISTQGQREVLKLLRPDMGEMAVQGLHEYVYRRYGAEFQGYPSIVGGGANGCILHYETNDRQRLDNDLVAHGLRGRIPRLLGRRDAHRAALRHLQPRPAPDLRAGAGRPGSRLRRLPPRRATSMRPTRPRRKW